MDISRFIPTYVGHTAGCRWPGSRSSVHPHIRGAYGVHSVGVVSIDRFIPTYVGHTGSAHVFCPPLPVHHHIRGVYRVLDLQEGAFCGSSPHTWGIRLGRDHFLIVSRFIPTYVGHTAPQAASRKRCSVHPHIRGAYFRVTSSARNVPGSSPHTWGIQAEWPVSAPAPRFIPTYVGHTVYGAVQNPIPPVHPHIRGAYVVPQIGDIPGHGSSPHTWGIRRNAAM